MQLLSYFNSDAKLFASGKLTLNSSGGVIAPHRYLRVYLSWQSAGLSKVCLIMGHHV
ncbi:hypothetical protein yrohd0001_26790 [Yersinia rohdei ATCC 43380]|nr:hypothetical protein yrohd0001_26790 [Yersinia rohdei ATCC 43380]